MRKQIISKFLLVLELAEQRIEDIRLFAQNIGSDVKMKAAGGVKSREDLEIFLEAGCDRIGTSSAVKMLEEN